MSRILDNEIMGDEAVSYTHLDVYKRQLAWLVDTLPSGSGWSNPHDAGGK